MSEHVTCKREQPPTYLHTQHRSAQASSKEEQLEGPPHIAILCTLQQAKLRITLPGRRKLSRVGYIIIITTPATQELQRPWIGTAHREREARTERFRGSTRRKGTRTAGCCTSPEKCSTACQPSIRFKRWWERAAAVRLGRNGVRSTNENENSHGKGEKAEAATTVRSVSGHVLYMAPPAVAVNFGLSRC